MVNQNLSANTVVRKITFLNEMELYQKIENLTSGSPIYKLNAVVSINPTSAYIILTPDVDKVAVSLVNLSGEDETLPDAPNGDVLIMNIDELRFLREQGSIDIAGEYHEIEDIAVSYNLQGERTATMSISKT